MKSLKTVRSLFFVFMLCSGLLLIFTPDMGVVATENYFLDFDDYTNYDWVNESWCTFKAVPPSLRHFVYTGEHYSGLYAWYIINGGYTRINFTNTDFESLSFRYFPGFVGGGNEYISLSFQNDSIPSGLIFYVRIYMIHTVNKYTHNIYAYPANTWGWGTGAADGDTDNIAVDDWYRCIIEKVAANIYNVSLYDENDVFVMGVTSGMDEVWDEFNHIRITPANIFYIDDLGYNGGSGEVGNADGNITICVYNESDPSVAIPNWNLLIYDHLGGIYYSQNNLNNPVTINHSVYGTGETYFEISATGYYNRTYYADIRNGIHYILDAFLPYDTGVHLYYIQCIDSTDDAVYDVELHITRALNGSLQEIASGFTNAFGAYPVYLIESTEYFINLSKTNYNSYTLQSFITDPDDYGVENPIIFVMNTAEITINLSDMSNIHFNGTINSTGVIHIWYEDYNSSTINTNIRIYEYNSSSDSYAFNHSDSRNGNNKFDFTDTGYNTSRMHKAVLYLNHTLLGYRITSIFIMPIRTLTEETTLETYFEDVFGDFELGWIKTFIIFVPCIFFLIVFGSSHVGLGIMTSGMYLGFSTYFLNINNTAVIAGETIFVPVALMLILVGVIVIIVKRGHRVL